AAGTLHHDTARVGVGGTGDDSTAGRAGTAPCFRTRICPSPQRHGSAHRDSLGGAHAVSIDSSPTLPLHRAGSAPLVGRRPAAADPVALDAVAALGLSLSFGFAQ